MAAADRSRRVCGKNVASVAVVILSPLPMPSINLRPCPFCASRNLTVATLGSEQTQFVVVTCSGCGAMGPRANVTDPPGRAEFVWNQRFGLVLSIGPLRRT